MLAYYYNPPITKDHYVWIGTPTVRWIRGNGNAPGQNQKDPQAAFLTHTIVLIGTDPTKDKNTIYDPSYGMTYAPDAKRTNVRVFQDAAIAGYYTVRSVDVDKPRTSNRIFEFKPVVPTTDLQLVDPK